VIYCFPEGHGSARANRQAAELPAEAQQAQNRPHDKLPRNGAETRGLDVPVGIVIGLVHELNNLMTVIAASVQRASAQPGSEAQAAELARANWGVERAEQLTQRLLGSARNSVATWQVSELGELVGNLKDPIMQMVDREIELRLEPTSHPLPVHVDAAQFELALLNLVRNAVDAMRDGGALTIRAAGWKMPQFVAVTVADTGEGMKPEALQRATEPFFTTKARGNGLGLSLVRHFAEMAGGWLEIDSTPGRGTRVAMVLPRSGDA
jgi:signal transduction histidine kinase